MHVCLGLDHGLNYGASHRKVKISSIYLFIFVQGCKIWASYRAKCWFLAIISHKLKINIYLFDFFLTITWQG